MNKVFQRIFKDFKTTVMGLVFIGASIYVSLNVPITTESIEFITLLLTSGSALLFAPDKFIDAFESKVFGKPLFKQSEKKDE